MPLFLLLLQISQTNKQNTINGSHIINTTLKDASVHLQVRIHSLIHPWWGLSVFQFWGRAVTTMIKGCMVFENTPK